MSIENKSSVSRSNQVNCSPKSYVKDAKEKYLKMNINSLQKVRLKLKLTSKNWTFFNFPLLNDFIKSIIFSNVTLINLNLDNKNINQSWTQDFIHINEEHRD